MSKKFDVAIVGGAGHVGLPLALFLASKGMQILIYDLDAEALHGIREGRMPFMEDGGEEMLRQVLADGRLEFSSVPDGVSESETVFITIGTPVDEFLHPTLKVIQQCVDGLLPVLDDEQLIVLRSTVYPGVTEWMETYLRSQGRTCDVAFCPERMVQGRGLIELGTLPQIVSGVTPRAEERAAELFGEVAPSVVRLTPMEAEFAKLFSNASRYIHFAVSNQLFMICENAGVDFYRVLDGLCRDYPRAKDISSAGLAAGPCLFKDTMQLAAFFKGQFGLGHAAMLVNEGLPAFMLEMLEKRAAAQGRTVKTVGLLGMAFKANNDDIRASLSYKIKKLCRFHGMEVLTTDPYVRVDPTLLPLDEVVRRSDALILCAPHGEYATLDTSDHVVVDVWNFWSGKAPA